ncbi:MAG TPA: hypothetical protein VIV06_12170 [Candidatus Limnocylindrales bacterium]
MLIEHVFDQRTWPGVGDIDDCWVVAAIQCAHASGIARNSLPTCPEFRLAAGLPDRPGPTGGNMDHVLAAARTLWPRFNVVGFRGSWTALELHLGRGGAIWVALLSGRLPIRLRYGFESRHACTLFRDESGQLWLANPLQRNEPPPDRVTKADILPALEAVSDDGNIQAVVFPPPPVTRDAMIVTRGYIVEGRLVKRFRTTGSVRLIVPETLLPSETLPAGRELPILGWPRGDVRHRVVLVDTSRDGKGVTRLVPTSAGVEEALPDPTPYGPSDLDTVRAEATQALGNRLNELEQGLTQAQELAAKANAAANLAFSVLSEIREILGPEGSLDPTA